MSHHWLSVTENGIPVSQENIVVRLKSGTEVLGKNIDGKFSYSDPQTDSFIEYCEFGNNGVDEYLYTNPYMANNYDIEQDAADGAHQVIMLAIDAFEDQLSKIGYTPHAMPAYIENRKLIELIALGLEDNACRYIEYPFNDHITVNVRVHQDNMNLHGKDKRIVNSAVQLCPKNYRLMNKQEALQEKQALLTNKSNPEIAITTSPSL